MAAMPWRSPGRCNTSTASIPARSGVPRCVRRRLARDPRRHPRSDMIGLENGMLVQHASLGLGKVVAVEPTAVHVVFATHDARVATKLRLPLALSFLGPPAGSNAWLSALSGFALDPRTGRYERATTWLSHADAVARFTEAFPRAFEDP